MIYCSIDIETSGLDSEKNKVLSIGAIIEDTDKKLPFDEIPKFNAIVLQHEICGSPRAITMNKDIISLMGEYLEGDYEDRDRLTNETDYQFLYEENVVKELYRFLNPTGNLDCKIPKPVLINVAGKNFAGFDLLFLNKLPWFKKLIRVRQRILDPAILFCDWKIDETLPSLSLIKERSGIDGRVKHEALSDAWDVILTLRKFY